MIKLFFDRILFKDEEVIFNGWLIRKLYSPEAHEIIKCEPDRQ